MGASEQSKIHRLENRIKELEERQAKLAHVVNNYYQAAINTDHLAAQTLQELKKIIIELRSKVEGLEQSIHGHHE